MSGYPYAVAGALLLLGGLGIARSRDLVHSVVCLSVAQSGTFVLLLAIGYQQGAPAPVFTSGTLANGQVTLTGTTGSAGDVASIYDGNSWLGFATSGGNGKARMPYLLPALSNEQYACVRWYVHQLATH